LAAVVYAGAVRIGPVPALGGFLDPWSGVWAVARTAELPAHTVGSIPGLTGPVRVIYDDRDVPHIFATTIADATRALGFVVARDRLFQMELQTRATEGTLSQLVGADALPLDRQSRALGLAWSARRSYAAMSNSASRLVRAYAQGVNAWIDGLRPADRPFEYRLFGARPARWEPVYSLDLLKQMGLTLAYQNLERTRLAARALVGQQAAESLFPLHAPIQEPIQPNGADAPRFDPVRLAPPGEPDVRALTRLQAMDHLLASMGMAGSGAVEDAIGSNNWAVSPFRTAEGHAILAGDPHLNLTLPSIWYEVHLVVPDSLDVYGVTIPGTPGVVIGFNRDVAWSFTNTGADVMDFYEETVDDTIAPTRYRLDGEWRPLTRRVETYRDRAGRSIATDTIYHTHRGPMRRTGEGWWSLRWTVLEQMGEYRAFEEMARATSVDAWLDGWASYLAPAQNGLVADRNGSIAIRSQGRLPLRPGSGRGDVVFDGSTSASDWIGDWPLEWHPYALDPARGFLASANQEPIDPRVAPAYLGANWPSPWRAMHINRLLRDSDSLTPDDLRRFQTDPGSARADLFVPAFLEAAARVSLKHADSLLERAAVLLGEWDRRYTRDNERAVLFESAMDLLYARVWDELIPPGADGPRVFPGSAILAVLLNDPDSPWWDDRRTGIHETRDDLLTASLRDALRQVRDRLGPAAEGGWRWDRNLHANIFHLLRLPALSALGIPVQGGPSTLNPVSGRGTHGPSWRMVVDLGPQIRAWTVYPGGQSGNPASGRYDDRIDRWAAGELTEALVPLTAEEIPAARTKSTLVLIGGGE